MALDYRSMRDATQMATAMELAKAQNIGQSAASLGHAGGLAWKEGGQGLMNFLKGRINPFTQESIEDPNRVYGQPSDAYGGRLPKDVPMDERVSVEVPGVSYEEPNMDRLGQVPTHEARYGLLDAIARDDINPLTNFTFFGERTMPSKQMLEGYQDYLKTQKLQDEGLISDEMLYGPNNMVTGQNNISQEPTGAAAGGEYGSYNKEAGTYEYAVPGGPMTTYNIGEGPGAINQTQQDNEANADSMLGLIQNQQPSPINANQMDTQFGKGFSNLQPDFRMAFRNTGGAKLPNKYSTDPKVLEFLENQGINPWDVIWE